MLPDLGWWLMQRPCNVAALCHVNRNFWCADLPLRRWTDPGPHPCAGTDTHANTCAIARDANIGACRAGRADPNALVQSQVPVNTTRVRV